ncbi:hypothetical protein HIM_02832 [Hirsutella minnesotensis 3608]|nr:hypothetical protein HIM_02832 [Hirsutella minnesotensis 3608]
MASVQDRRAPSAGTKVTAGENVPVTRESAGFVASDSLAAESYTEGGEFSENRSAQPSESTSKSGIHPSQQMKTFSGESGTAAPSYVASQGLTDTSGPHGKNLKEGGFDDARVKDGLKVALESEPGSINDPSRLTEAQLQQTDAAQPGSTARRDGDLSNTTAFDALDRTASS